MDERVCSHLQDASNLLTKEAEAYLRKLSFVYCPSTQFSLASENWLWLSKGETRDFLVISLSLEKSAGTGIIDFAGVLVCGSDRSPSNTWSPVREISVWKSKLNRAYDCPGWFKNVPELSGGIVSFLLVAVNLVAASSYKFQLEHNSVHPDYVGN